MIMIDSEMTTITSKIAVAVNTIFGWAIRESI